MILTSFQDSAITAFLIICSALLGAIVTPYIEYVENKKMSGLDKIILYFISIHILMTIITLFLGFIHLLVSHPN